MASQNGTAARLTGMDDQIAACRAWGHTWPSRLLRAGRPLPKGYQPKLIEDGYVEVTESCMNNCGKKRHFLLFPGGIYDTDVTRTYTDPKNWPVLHREEGITRRHIQAEVVRRVQEEIMAAAISEASREARAGAPDVIFRAGQS